MLLRVSEDVSRQADESRRVFLAARPFRHIAIENFFDADFAERLLAEFPVFETKLAINESGKAGGKSVNTNIRSISPAYQELYELIASRPFIGFIERISGIDGLVIDPKMYGGGTHENLHGQDLDPHVDFNFDEDEQLHRRLNLIVYLNKDWKPEWGGGLEIHSNPRRPNENQIATFDPLFNRCVMFETNEYSWHGFPKITLPECERHRSRKSLSIYLYTKERPAEEVAPVHRTFYVQRPLPPEFHEGRTLDAAGVAELQRLMIRRDTWIELYQKMELDKNRTLSEARQYVADLEAHLRMPLTGYVLQDGLAQGLYPGDWASSRVRLRLSPLMPVKAIRLEGWRLEDTPAAQVTILVNGVEAGKGKASAGMFQVTARLRKPLREAFDIEIRCDSAGPQMSPDGQGRAFTIVELRASHPGITYVGSAFRDWLSRGRAWMRSDRWDSQMPKGGG
jgi:hypothetical protein